VGFHPPFQLRGGCVDKLCNDAFVEHRMAEAVGGVGFPLHKCFLLEKKYLFFWALLPDCCLVVFFSEFGGGGTYMCVLLCVFCKLF